MAATVEVSPSTVRFQAVGDTLQLTVEVKDGNGNAMAGAAITWSSNAAGVATVDANGLVTAQGPGTAVVTATTGELSDSTSVIVDRPVAPGPSESAADRAALVAFYESAGGDNWVNRSNWLSDAPISEWHGVWVDPQSGRVVNIDLNNNNLEGPVSPRIGELTGLTELILTFNKLSGSLPPELGQLENLEDLRVAVNDFSGAIPVELANLAGLTNLSLAQNKLSGPIPPQLGNLANLKELRLGRNNLSGPIPPELGNLSQLESLYLHGNAPPYGSHGLSGPIPPELSKLSRLTILVLWGNKLSGPVPPELGNLTALEKFDIIDNMLSGRMPAELTRMPLKVFRWAGNDQLCQPDTNAFSTWLANASIVAGGLCNQSDRAILAALHEAAGGSGWMNASGWPDGPVDSRYGIKADASGRVVAINLSDNGLSGRLPDELGDLALLEELRLGGNRGLSGRLPYTLARIGMLRELRYAGTDLCVPQESFLREWLGKLPQHEGTGADCALSADRDVLRSIYESMGGERWHDSSNWLSDAPLREWHGVQADGQGRVVSLDLSFNGLVGPIPADIGALEALADLMLNANDTKRSPLPPEIGELKNLKNLKLGGIFAAGPIPPRIGKLARLESLDLSGNELSGSIPPEFGDLASLTFLDLDNNRLTGSIPEQLANAAELEQIHLADNNLSGALPTFLGSLGKLFVLDLSGNGFSGSLPSSFGEFPSLEYLNLSYNNLAGAIPAELGNSPSLNELYLGSNSFAGPLPSELANLTRLHSLALTGNAELAGPLPANLADLREMAHFQAEGTGLCAPQDARLLGWLNGLLTRRVRQCGVEPAAAYLTQAIQSRDLPIALVAGEQALLRVFPTAEQANSERIPRIQADLFLGGALRHEIDIPSSAGPIPTRLDESSLERSANAIVPAEFVQPGLEIVIEIDPEGTLDDSLGVPRRIPQSGRLAVEVREMPVFDITFIPFLWETNPDMSVVDLVNAMEADPMGHAMLEQTRRLLPIADIKVTAHAAVRTSSNDAIDLIAETQLIATMEGGSSYYMGLLAGESSGASGIGNVGQKTAYSVTDADVIAHEFGHNLSMQHTPCGSPLGLEPAFPYPDGSSGRWGYDFAAKHLVSPMEYRDLMSYCSPYWISDFSFDKTLRHRLHRAGLLRQQSQARAPSEESLVMWGGRDKGAALFLEPAFVTQAPPALPEEPGPYRIRGQAADGTVLFDLSFDMPAAGDGGGSSSFVFALPMQAASSKALDSITLSGPFGRSATLNQETDKPVTVLRNGPGGAVTAIIREPNAAAALRGATRPGLFSRGIPRTSGPIR
ncbi:MAG: Ig-like domain-containing protein [Gammaproteobacteria bacterium]|nr:Ig-like domain-containing protein [Gammaproteobacteria bacterium]MCY4255371.1 Ig-like domain-containing protein [Gammaproteobacteria bacterium]